MQAWRCWEISRSFRLGGLPLADGPNFCGRDSPACTFFLPLLKKKKRGTHLNTSQPAGCVGAIGQSAYCASKFAGAGFTESLRSHELAGHEHLRYDCASGRIRTAIGESGALGRTAGEGLRQQSLNRFHPITRTDPEVAAAKILRGV